MSILTRSLSVLLGVGAGALLTLTACFESTTTRADGGPEADGGGAGSDGGNGWCYSPTQNAERAYEEGAKGCACTEEDPDQCVGPAALVCLEGHWLAVEDGPCAPEPDCPNGKIVATESECAQDTSCTRLSDGRYCSGGMAPRCPAGATAVAADAECPADRSCFEAGEGIRCAQRYLSTQDCQAQGGAVVTDPGDGSVFYGGCPEGGVALGAVSGDWIEGALCCLPSDGCAPQEAHYTGGCEPVGLHYWNGLGCEMRTGCDCLGAACQQGYPTREQCEDAHATCAESRVFCGGWSGDTCTDEQYCAYQVGQLCGGADAGAVCVARPSACPDLDDPVCGCDNKRYANTCEAAQAGIGVVSYGACGS